ncbi:V-type ATPase subunit [Candidatus Micrarchaeota archaeon]|nr:V-type ATPase subunit [Candidatus Micrarchaeota archaeon]MBU2477137.1 V-type ATPase subunit [Candidatus Micrarchaeota archaeon]
MRERIEKTSGKIKEIFREKALFLDALNTARAKETKIQMKNILQEKKNKIVVEDIKKSRIELRKKMSEKGRKMVHVFRRDSSPVIGYFIAKENEVDNLRIIARGKQANLPLELIEQQLVY